MLRAVVPLISEAIVVRVVDYGEADRVATLLTRRAGKVSALARGARKSRRRFAALQLFAHGEARIREGRGELWTLESFDVASGHPHLALDITRVAHGAYACELARELSPPHHPEPRLFDLLAELLALLDATPASPPGAPHLRVYELAVLEAVGFAPSLDRCVACERDLGGAVEDEGGDQLDVRRGGVVCGRCGGHAPGRRPLPARVRRLLLRAQRTPLAAWPSLRGGDEEVPPASETWDGAREALQALLQEQLGHPLRSVEFIAKLNAGRA